MMANLGQLGSKSWSFIDNQIVNLKHSWTISNPRFLFSKNRSILKSCPFEAGSYTSITEDSQKQQRSSHEWMIQIMKYWYGNQYFYDFYLVYVAPSEEEKPSDIPDIPVQFELELLNSAGSSILRRASDVVVFSRSNAMHGFPKFVKEDEFMEMIILENIITVVCELTLLTKQEYLTGKGDIFQFDAPTSTLARDFEALYSRKELADVTFVIGNQQFKAHKPILMARSPVLAAMFRVDMQEKLNNRVEIEDIEAKAFEKLLQFVYTDQVLDLGTHAKELLMAAEKYGLDRLKAMCEQELSRKLSGETAAETLMLADLHNAEKLKKRVMNFIWNNKEKVLSTTAWKNLFEQQPRLVAELVNLKPEES